MQIRKFGYYWLNTWVMANIIQLDTFKEEGGFTEALTAERLAARAEKSLAEGAPQCPKCGKPMIKRMVRKGINSGKEFWSCSSYPECNGTRNI